MRELVLIVEPIATNRIVLRSLFEAARYRVACCATAQEADVQVERERPDIVILDIETDLPHTLGFCRRICGINTGLKGCPPPAPAMAGGASGLPVIGICAQTREAARIAFLKAGAIDVFERPLSEGLLLARIRSIIRNQKALADLAPSNGRAPALGFAESSEGFRPPRRFVILSRQEDLLRTTFGNGFAEQGDIVEFHPPKGDFVYEGADSPDLFVIDASRDGLPAGDLLRLLADLRSHAAVRHAAQVIILPSDTPDLAASALDLGANDVVSDMIGPTEMAIRLRSLLRQKETNDMLRSQMRSGLEASVIDPLMGLYNRRAGLGQLAAIAKHATKSGSEFATMILDIDHFKSVNDTYGHQTGDAVLRQVAEALQTLIDPVGMVARIGGEEFLVAIPDTTAGQAEAIAQSIRSCVSQSPLRARTATGLASGPSKEIAVTMSVGVALGGPGITSDAALAALMERADRALFAAKSAGRDRVTFNTATTAA